MRFFAAAALVAATCAAASAVSITYGSRGIVAVNYGACRNAKAQPSAVVAHEASIAGFRGFQCVVANAELVTCAGTASPGSVCADLRSRCELYQGAFIADACHNI
ncbi:hypothetical protein GQ42DRAFT_165470 [Ramicandelaber brevisporus]|nr:hypothetical protein GQ42DRAFT_165470 [Ramicandelaber brevisporus]